ncbi:MAG: hypothetical protein ING22_05830 [Burkholderiales bacterium]|nr:hypothetical protein [Burkholderiales bacterium]
MSTPDSFAAGAISVLALFETVAAMALYAYIAFRHGTFHLTVAACIAPFLLLRTDESVRFALHHSKSFRDLEMPRPSNLPRSVQQSVICLALLALSALALTPLFTEIKDQWYIGLTVGVLLLTWFTGVLALITLVLPPFFMRVVATLHGIYICPGCSVANIPSNWWRQVASLDSLHPPEVLPGAILHEAERDRVSELQPFGYFLTSLISAAHLREGVYSMVKSVLRVAANVMAYMTAAVPTYLFRLSIKGTSLLLLPLVWLVYDARSTKPEHFVKSSLVKGIFKASCFVLLVFLGVLCFSAFGTDFGYSEQLTKLYALRSNNALIRAFFPVDGVPVWQVVLLLLASLSIATFLFAERLSIRGACSADLRVFQSMLGSIGLFAVILIFVLLGTSAAEAKGP